MKTRKNGGEISEGFLCGVGLVAVIMLIACITSCTTVDAGSIGVRTQFGRVTENSVEPGLHFVNPIGGSIVKYDVREQKKEIMAPTYTKDMQQADITVIVTYALNKSDVGVVHQTYGTGYADKVVLPKVIAAVKDVIGGIEATELINAREKAARAILENATTQLASAKIPVTITSLVLANIDYSDTFERSIEEKVVAQQNAIRAQNETKRVEEEARQTVVRANAEAEAIRIRAQAFKENSVALLLQDAIKRWDGKLPTTFMGTVPSAVLDMSNFVK